MLWFNWAQFWNQWTKCEWWYWETIKTIFVDWTPSGKTRVWHKFISYFNINDFIRDSKKRYSKRDQGCRSRSRLFTYWHNLWHRRSKIFVPRIYTSLKQYKWITGNSILPNKIQTVEKMKSYHYLQVIQLWFFTKILNLTRGKN